MLPDEAAGSVAPLSIGGDECPGDTLALSLCWDPPRGDTRPFYIEVQKRCLKEKGWESK